MPEPPYLRLTLDLTPPAGWSAGQHDRARAALDRARGDLVHALVAAARRVLDRDDCPQAGMLTVAAYPDTPAATETP
jgi:hypothetical protein